MSDQEQDLTLGVAVALTDYIRTVATPGAVPESQVVTLANLQASIRSLVGLTSLQVPALQKRTSADFDKTSDTALANVTGLTVNVEAGKNYRITVRLHIVCNSSGGVKVAIGGTCTAGAIVYDALILWASSCFSGRGTALAGAIGITNTANPIVEIVGLVSVTVGGTLTVMFAQNASYATKSTVKIGSSLFVDEVL